MQIDVFNGDADGLCALVQLRLAQPMDSVLVTGIKRDIELLAKVQAGTGDKITVLDISFAKNQADVQRLLAAGAEIFYVDHHQAGDIPQHPALTALIDTDANVCTSLLVDKHLNGQFKAWAVTAAFGDNLDDSAIEAAKSLSLSATELEQLKNLGICINYNGYGASVGDLHFDPAVLFKELVAYASPFDFMRDNAAAYQKLLNGYQNDMQMALTSQPEYLTDAVAVYILPDEAWSRRISGVFGNELANRYPDRAHAILSFNKQGGYLVSVRASLTNKTGADELCTYFPSGGGRKSAAGINHLPKEQLAVFIEKFSAQYQHH